MRDIAISMDAGRSVIKPAIPNYTRNRGFGKNFLTNYDKENSKIIRKVIYHIHAKLGKKVLTVREKAKDQDGKIIKGDIGIYWRKGVEKSVANMFNLIDEMTQEILLEGGKLKVCKECGCVEWSSNACDNCHTSSNKKNYEIMDCKSEDLEVRSDFVDCDGKFTHVAYKSIRR